MGQKLGPKTTLLKWPMKAVQPPKISEGPQLFGYSQEGQGHYI